MNKESKIKYGQHFESTDMHGQKRTYKCADVEWLPNNAVKIKERPDENNT